MGLCVIDISFH